MGIPEEVLLSRLAGAENAAEAALIAARQTPPVRSVAFSKAQPLQAGHTYQMKSTDALVIVQAGANVILPVAPIEGIEYSVKVAEGNPQASPVNIFASGTMSVEDPSAINPYTFRSGLTPATMTIAGGRSGWTSDGAVMNQTT